MKETTRKIQVVAEADIRCGNADKLIAIMPDLIRDEKYEDCAGIQNAFNQAKKEEEG